MPTTLTGCIYGISRRGSWPHGMAARTSTMDVGVEADEIRAMDNLPPPFPPPSRHWWQRNWPWAVPTGCLSLLFAFAVLGGGIMLTVLNVTRSSDVYRAAVHRAETNARVANALGTPITEGIFTTGNINVFNDAGRANLAIPIEGSKGKGTIYLVATRPEGVWDYSRMDVRVEGTGQIIDLREPSP